MVYMEPRKNADGSVESYLVRWRPGKDPAAKMAYEPFKGPNAQLRANKFMIEVELAGEDWPPFYAPHPISRYLTAQEWEAYANPALAAAPAARPSAGAPLPTYAADYVDRLTGIQASTKAGYHRLLANYVHSFPAFAGADMADPDSVTEDDIADWVNWLDAGERDEADTGWLRAPKSPKTIANAHGLLFAVFARACRGERPLRRINPCADTRLPSLDDSTGEEMVFLTPEEFRLLWQAADARARDVLVVAVGTAARFGEYTALQVGDFDLECADGGLPGVRVDRAWKRQTDSAPTIGSPKSKAGRRRVTIDPVTVAVVAPLIEGRAPGAYLFTDSRGEALRHGTWYGPLWQPTVYRAVRCEEHRALDRSDGILIDGEMVRLRSRRQLTMRWIVPCGCPGTLRKVPRTHDLRHTAVAWLIAARRNVPLSAIADRLGHKSVITTDRTYGHLLPELDARQSDAMDAAMSPLNITPSGLLFPAGRKSLHAAA